MGFVVDKVPFGNEVMIDRPVVVVGITKSFDTGAKEGVVKKYLGCTTPDDFPDSTGLSTGTAADTGKTDVTRFQDGA